MDYKLIIALWAIFAVSVIYWDQHRWDNVAPISVCHNAPVKFYQERAHCTKCHKYCKVKK